MGYADRIYNVIRTRNGKVPW